MLNLLFDYQDTLNRWMFERRAVCKSRNLLLLCLGGVIDPVDSKKWPGSWRKSEGRLVTVLNGLDEEYWNVLKVLEDVPRRDIDEWNEFADMDRSKLLRVLSNSVVMPKVYLGGRYLWDMLVLSYLKGGQSMQEVLKSSTKGAKLDVLVPKWCWRYLKWAQRMGVPKQKEIKTNITEGLVVISD